MCWQMKYKPMNEEMSNEFCVSYKYVCQICSQWCTILMCETYKLWMNEFLMIFIPKS
jgi:hypothetical protein